VEGVEGGRSKRFGAVVGQGERFGRLRHNLTQETTGLRTGTPGTGIRMGGGGDASGREARWTQVRSEVH